jgi:hypothetical protein
MENKNIVLNERASRPMRRLRLGFIAPPPRPKTIAPRALAMRICQSCQAKLPKTFLCSGFMAWLAVAHMVPSIARLGRNPRHRMLPSETINFPACNETLACSHNPVIIVKPDKRSPKPARFLAHSHDFDAARVRSVRTGYCYISITCLWTR